MKKNVTLLRERILLAILFSFLFIGRTFATNVSGNQNGMWPLSGSPYVLTGNVTVQPGQTLTIEPGVVVQFPSSNSQLLVQGTLTAVGTAANPIRFTGGNFPFGTQRGPVNFEATSQNSVMQYVMIDGLGFYGAGDLDPVINLRTSSCSITNCTFQNINGSAIQIANVTPVVRNNVFASNAFMDVVLDVDKVKLLSGNNALKIGLTAGAAMADNDTLTAGNVYYRLEANQTIPQGKTLTISPGVELQFPGSNSQITVQGTLSAQGTASNYIRFTGGNFPFGTRRGPINFEVTSQNSIMQYVTVDALGFYGAGDLDPIINLRTSSCSITNCNLLNLGGSAIQIANVSPIVSNNVFTNNAYMDVLVDLDKVRLLTGNNALKIGLTAIVAMANNDTLTASNVYYRLEANQTIPQSRTLTINPGVELQFPGSNSQITVQGTLNAKGTTANYIHFTGGNFPFGTTRGPVNFETTSQSSVMQYVTVDALGYYGAGELNPAINVRTSSCTITNCNLQNINGSAIQIANVTPVVSNNMFTSNAFMDVVLDVDKLKLLTGNNAMKIGLTAGAAMADNDTLTASNVFYRLLVNQIVPQSRTLTISPGAEVQFPGSNSQITVQGTLIAKGTVANYIRFTGGNFPFGTRRGPVNFEAVSQNSIMQYVTVDALGFYGAGDLDPVINLRTSSCSITNCNFQNINGSAVQIANVTPVVSNNVFTSNAFMDVLLDLDKVKLLRGNNALKIGLTATAAMADNDTLPASNVYYRLEANQTIPQGKTLTINPGVEVQFPGSNSQLIVQGTLIAKGAATNYIRFTGGNFPFGTTRGPITFETISQNSLMQFVTVNSLGYYSGGSTNPIVVIRSSSTQLSNCIVQNSSGVAVAIQNASPLIIRSCFYDNGQGAVWSTGGKPRFINCNFLSNAAFGINNTSTTDTVDARNCWWGNASGPKQTTTNPSGTGDAVSARVLYNPWSTTQLDCSVSEVIVPLKLTGFEVTLISNRANCTWQVTSEVNTSHFIIQRSTDGINYIDIGKVNAAGSTSSNLIYTFTDPAPNSGINFYRLKMFDKDGGFAYSKVLVLNRNNTASFVIYPNPVKDDLLLQLQSSTWEKVTLQIADIEGRILQQKDYQLQIGTTTISFNTSSLSKGTYVLILKGQKVEKKIFIKE